MESPDPPLITVRYWAAARAAAGRESDRVPAATLAEALRQVVALHAGEPRFADVVKMCSVLVGSTPVSSRDPETVPVAPDTVVELLPPFAGG